MTFFVYILKCSNGSYYVGHTEDLGKRMKVHQAGDGAYHTKINKPFKLAYSEMVDSKSLAVKREMQLKKWSKSKKEALISGDFTKLKVLCKKNFSTR